MNVCQQLLTAPSFAHERSVPPHFVCPCVAPSVAMLPKVCLALFSHAIFLKKKKFSTLQPVPRICLHALNFFEKEKTLSMCSKLEPRDAPSPPCTPSQTLPEICRGSVARPSDPFRSTHSSPCLDSAFPSLFLFFLARSVRACLAYLTLFSFSFASHSSANPASTHQPLPLQVAPSTSKQTQLDTQYGHHLFVAAGRL